MHRDSNSNGTVSNWHGNDSVLRHSDGTINFDAYRAAGRRAREAAIVSSITGAVSFARAMLSWTGNALTGKSASTGAKHQAHQAR